MKRITIILAVIALLPYLGACTPTQTTPDLTVVIATSVQENSSSYPAPQQDNNHTYPDTEQEQTLNIPETDPKNHTTDPNKAMVNGVLLLNNNPIPGAILYLSKVIYSENREVKLVSFDRQADTRTFTNQQGEFVFFNISPGEYGMVMDTISNAYLLSKPDGSEEIILDLSSGDVIDLGQLDYNDLPISAP